MATTHEPLDREDGVLWVGDLLMLCLLTNEAFAFFGESDDGWGRAVARAIDKNLWGVAFHDSDDRVGCSKVDSDDFAHC